MEPIYYASIAAQLLTYASFLSGAKVCHLIHKQKSCANFSPAPFLAGLNCTVLWLRYGFISNEWEIITVNLVGVICQCCYLAFYVAYSNEKARLMKQMLGLLLFLLILLYSIDQSVDPLFLGGSLASLASLFACASPLVSIKEVLRTKCVDSMPLPIISSTFVVSFSWLIFGYLKEDNFIVLSNLVAVSICGAQLALFVIYPSTQPYEKLSQSNKKSYDLIKLLNSNEEEDEFDSLELDDANDEEIDTNENYKETLRRIMGQIYSKRERLSKSSGTALLLYSN